MSCKPIFSVEANADAEKRIQSKGYVLNIAGDLMRGISKDFILTAYALTKTKETSRMRIRNSLYTLSEQLASAILK